MFDFRDLFDSQKRWRNSMRTTMMGVGRIRIRGRRTTTTRTAPATISASPATTAWFRRTHRKTIRSCCLRRRTRSQRCRRCPMVSFTVRRWRLVRKLVPRVHNMVARKPQKCWNLLINVGWRDDLDKYWSDTIMAEESTSQGNLEMACWGLCPTMGHNGYLMMMMMKSSPWFFSRFIETA